MMIIRPRAQLWAAAAALALLASAPGNARAAEGRGSIPFCYENGWKPTCVVGLDCTPEDPYDDEPCNFVLPVDCPEVESIDCGEMFNRVQLDACIAAKRICSRATQIGEGSSIAVYEYVQNFDFVSGALAALPGDLICQGMMSSDTDRWCSYVKTVYPDASFLETSVWRARDLSGKSAAEPFARLDVEPHSECRMREGELVGRLEISADSVTCLPDAPPPGPRDESLRLSDVAFSDTNHDLYLDAVLTYAWTSGGSGRMTGTLTLTQLETDGPLLHVRGLGPGFDCTKAGTPTEENICADPKIAVLDLRLSKLYAHLRQETKLESDTTRRTTLRSEQRTFLKQRSDACAARGDERCAPLYRARITDLQRSAERHRCELSEVGCD
jgi:uncharacterized protein YecT (DUF1311 family)